MYGWGVLKPTDSPGCTAGSNLWNGPIRGSLDARLPISAYMPRHGDIYPPMQSSIGFAPLGPSAMCLTGKEDNGV